jgi:predicted TIM-barrel fold metal-dependent hydrolase
MIVDVHTHTPTHVDVVPDDELVLTGKFNNLAPIKMTNTYADYAAGVAAVDVSIVFNIQGRTSETDEQPPDRSIDVIEASNRATADFVASDPGRRIGFMSINPRWDGYIDEFDACLELGLKGIKLGPNYQQFDPLSTEAKALYRRAEARGVPILFHQGTSPVRFAPIKYAYPLLMDEIAMQFPELRIVMAHMGHPWVRETVVTIRKHPNLYADISALVVRPMMRYEALTFASEWGVLDKLLFASDFPVVTSGQTMDLLRSVNDPIAGTAMPKVSMEAVEKIIQAPSLDRLGLPDPTAS